MELAKDWGYKVEYRRVSVQEIREAADNGTLKEAFGAGTAATIAPIEVIGFEDGDRQLTEFATWEFAPKALKTLDAIKKGEAPDTHGWNHRVD